jgi:hypothetical protein
MVFPQPVKPGVSVSSPSRNYLETGTADCAARPAPWLVPTVKLHPTSTPPPVFWTQNPCFHELTGSVALYTLHKKGVARKIVQDKELLALLQDQEEDWRKCS